MLHSLDTNGIGDSENVIHKWEVLIIWCYLHLRRCWRNIIFTVSSSPRFPSGNLNDSVEVSGSE